MADIYLWIDDERIEPVGWLRASNAENAIAIISTYGSELAAISFDYDIGLSGNGGDVARYLLNNWQEHGVPSNVAFNIHSANPPGVAQLKEILGELYDAWDRPRDWLVTKSAQEMWKNSDI